MELADLKKLKWYVTKGLGTWEEGAGPDDAAPAVRLAFQHNEGDQDAACDAFYVQMRENRCVGCGTDGHYMKYRLVPMACVRASHRLVPASSFPIARSALALQSLDGLARSMQTVKAAQQQREMVALARH